jgi:hypothetical protein
MENLITLVGLLSLLAPITLTIGIIVEFIKLITTKLKRNGKRFFRNHGVPRRFANS